MPTPKTPPRPTVVPYLLYENLPDAMDWLARAFGLRVRHSMPGPDGRVSHAEMAIGDGVVMMGCPARDYRNPKRAGCVTQYLYVLVDDADTHCARARAAGAKLLEEPKDQEYGDRRYGAEDPEGHQWYFASPARA